MLFVAVVSLGLQFVAAVDAMEGMGRHLVPFERPATELVAVLWLALGLAIFLQRRSRYAGQLFLLSSAAGAVFLGLDAVYVLNFPMALAYAAGYVLFPPLLWSFVRALDARRSWTARELWLYAPPLLLVWPAAQGLASDRATGAWRAALALGALYLGAAIVQSLWDLRRAASPLQAAELRALSVGLIAGTLPGIVLYVLPIAISSHLAVDTSWLPFLILGFLLALSYAVLLFEFAESDLIIRRGVVYAVLTLGIVGIYVALALVLDARRTSVASPISGAGFVGLTVLIGAAFQPLQRAVRHLIDWLLYDRRVDRWDLLQALSARLGAVMQPDELGHELVSGVVSALHLRGAFLLQRDGSDFVVSSRSPSEREIPLAVLDADTVRRALGHPVRALLLVHTRPLTLDRRQHVPEPFGPLDALNAALFLPLVTRSGLDAVLCLQPKLAHDAFGSEDLELLAPLMQQAAVALDNALLVHRLAEKVHELQAAYARIARVQEQERARLARELHDGTSQELAALMTLAAVVEKQLHEGHPARAALEQLKVQAESAYRGVRRASHALRPLMLEDLGLARTLFWYVNQFQEGTGMIVHCQADDIGPLPDDVELALLRIAQESLENIRKHSHAEEAEVILQRSDGHILLHVSDRGQGMPRGGQRGIGLATMRERAESVGGSLQVVSSSGTGVTVEASVPVGGDDGTSGSDRRSHRSA